MSGGSMLNLQPSTCLRLWEWREDKINLIGATQSIVVRLRYEKISSVTRARHQSCSDSLSDRPLGVCDSCSGGALMRRAGSCAGLTGHGADGHGKSD